MADIQKSRVINRQGASSVLPSTLLSGEIGITTDTGEIFFGASSNPLVSGRTTYPYQNIKVLTEFDVARNITHDVYYHGPLLSTVVTATGSLAPAIMLFNNGDYDFMVYEFSLHNKASNIMAIGEIVACVASDPDTSQVVSTIKSEMNWPSAQAPTFGLSKYNIQNQIDGSVWLTFSNIYSIDLTLCIHGKQWKTPI